MAMLGLSRKTLAFSLAVLGACGCSSSGGFTSDAAGDYTVALTNGPNTCADFTNWMEGKTASGVSLTITQDGHTLHGTVNDPVTTVLFDLAFGSTNFDGTIDGTSLTLTNYGSRSLSKGNCSYTYNATVDGTQTGDSISGTITYAPKTNGNPDCSAVECSATQNFNGSRPPK